MLPALNDDAVQVPSWIMNASINDELPLDDILQRSMFYPASGYDGRPVQYFCGATHSFVYVDSSCSYDFVVKHIDTFKGYQTVFSKVIDAETLNIESFKSHGNILSNSNRFDYFNSPFFKYAIWVIFERLDDFDSNHGPQRFSLLYIGGEAVSVYWSLYWRRKISPFAITLIRCDGFTGNWTTFFSDKAELASLVMMNELGGHPKYLFSMFQGRDGDSPWRWYKKRVTTFHSVLDYSGIHHEHLSVWKYSPEPIANEDPLQIKCGLIHAARLDIEYNAKLTHRVTLQNRRQNYRRFVINKLIRIGINPLYASFFKVRLGKSCIQTSCLHCNGRALVWRIETLTKSEIIKYLAELSYPDVELFEIEIRNTLMYINAGDLTHEELSELSNKPFISVLKRIVKFLRLDSCSNNFKVFFY